MGRWQRDEQLACIVLRSSSRLVEVGTAMLWERSQPLILSSLHETYEDDLPMRRSSISWRLRLAALISSTTPS